LKDKASRSELSKEELKLRGARGNVNPKKIVEALNVFTKATDVATHFSHLEGKEVFSSSKHKLDLSIGLDGDSH